MCMCVCVCHQPVSLQTLIVLLPQGDGGRRLGRDSSVLARSYNQLLAVQDSRHHAVGVVEPA